MTNESHTHKHLISQICVVTYDLDKTMYEYSKRLGWGPWKVYDHSAPTLHDTYLRGEPTEFSMLGAETMVGDMGFEIIQPTSGKSIYQEFLDERGEGVQHIAVMKHSVGDSDELIADVGAPRLMGGRIGENIEFYYLETAPNLKVVVESGTGHAIDLQPVRIFSLD